VSLLRVSLDCLEQTLAHLRADLPREGVGLWVGRRGRVMQVWPLENTHEVPELYYQASPQAIIEAVQNIEARGLELVAIYHSHPYGSAQPSQTDRSQAFWRVPYVIVAMRTSELRAYWLPEGEPVEVQLETAAGCKS